MSPCHSTSNSDFVHRDLAHRLCIFPEVSPSPDLQLFGEQIDPHSIRTPRESLRLWSGKGKSFGPHFIVCATYNKLNALGPTCAEWRRMWQVAAPAETLRPWEVAIKPSACACGRDCTRPSPPRTILLCCSYHCFDFDLSSSRKNIAIQIPNKFTSLLFYQKEWTAVESSNWSWQSPFTFPLL